MFAPAPIACQEFLLSGNTQSRISDAEIRLARIDERLRTSPIGLGLRKNLARLEAIATLRIAGFAPAYDKLINIEYLYNDYRTSHPDASVRDFLEEHDGLGEAEVETFKYLQTLLWITETVVPGEPFTRGFLLDIHSMCLHGALSSETGSMYRTRAYQVSSEKASHGLYRPALPEEMDGLIADLFEFVNAESYAPTAQAALAHFQFESIKPFKSGLDRTGRAMCHAIMYRRGAFLHCIPPIALAPAAQTVDHAKFLLPYDMGIDVEGRAKLQRIDEWTWFCGYSTDLAARIIEAYVDAFEALELYWRERIGKFNKGSALELLLPMLIGNPITTVSLAMGETGRSFSATNDALNRLEKTGILESSNVDHERTRIFSAHEVLEALDDFEKLFIKQAPVARDAIYRRADGTLSVSGEALVASAN